MSWRKKGMTKTKYTMIYTLGYRNGSFSLAINEKQFGTDWTIIDSDDEKYFKKFMKWASIIYDFENRPENPYSYTSKTRPPTGEEVANAYARYRRHLSYTNDKHNEERDFSTEIRYGLGSGQDEVDKLSPEELNEIHSIVRAGQLRLTTYYKILDKLR